MNSNEKLTTLLPTTTEDVNKKSLDYSLFTWVAQETANPIAVKDAEGCYFWDYDGNKFFDLSSQLICSNIGHKNKKVLNAIKTQVEKLAYIKPQFTSDIRGALAEKIIKDFAPDNMGKVMFSLGGAESNEYAIRMAKVATGRTKIFSQYNSYHGATYGAANLCGEVHRNVSDPQIAGFIHFHGPNWLDTLDIKFESEEAKTKFLLDTLEDQLIFEGPNKVAAIFFEAMTGGNGCIVPPKGYYKGVRELCDKYGIIFVADEVMAGFGRTGKKFCMDYFDVKPDMITFAKGVTSGYLPFGGVILNKELSSFFDKIGVPIGCTYNSHPVCCAAALATLEVYEEENLIDNCYNMGKLVEEGLATLIKKHPSVVEQRGLGLLRCYVMADKLRTNEYQDLILQKYRDRGYSTFGRQGTLMIAPPLIVTKEEIEEIINITDEILTEMDELM